MCNGLSLIIPIFLSKCETRAKLREVAVKALFLDAGIRIIHKCALSKLSQVVSLVRPASSFYRAVKVGSLFM